jgi:5-formyltetrahydrofolate cyclo-ligase
MALPTRKTSIIGRAAAMPRAAARLRYHRRMPPPSDPVAGALHGAALREAKMALRRQVLARRDALDPAARAAAAQAITRGLIALPTFGAARAVLLTAAYGSEWDTRSLAVAALAAGKVVAMPRVNATTRMLELHRVTDPAADIAPGYRGIPEPLPHCPAVAVAAIDWVLVPGVAFDAAGGRLGYGGGFYDRLLPLLAPGTARVAGAYDMQLVDRVPAAPHDLAVEVIVTATRTIVAQPGR